MAANSRTTTTRTKPRTVRPAPVEPDDVEDFDADDGATEAEAQELEATGHYVTVALGEEPMRVAPAGTWPVSAQRALRNGDLDGFMKVVLHEDDYDLYEDVDPTMDEFNQFVEDAGRLAGEPQGKSRGPNRSSRRTQRR